ISQSFPEKLVELKKVFETEAKRNSVFPLDDRLSERFNPELAGRPDVLRGRTEMTLRPGMRRLAESAVPNVKNKTHSIAAEIAPNGRIPEGVLLAQGSRFGGWSLYVREGYLTYSYNW